MAIDNTYGCGCVPITLYLQKQARGCIWHGGHSGSPVLSYKQRGLRWYFMNLWNVVTLETVIKRKCSLQVTVMFPDTVPSPLLTAPDWYPIIQKLCLRKEVGSVAGSSPTWLGL